jgi:pimeloyl-ACP methyl ester carboxylesterase
VKTKVTQDLNVVTAFNSKTQFIESNGRKIAYRSIGNGKPILLANRFRGNLDVWDPAFLDNLAKKHTVITFNYSGLASSTGKPGTTILDFANDIKDLAEALGYKKAIVGGWSFGGFAAIVAATEYPDLFTHSILLGTNPPGQNEHQIEEKFFDVSRRLNYTVEDETYLFFEPASKASCKAAQLSHNRIATRVTDLDLIIPEELWDNFTYGVVDYVKDSLNSREKLLIYKTPTLLLNGDHDICFPAENWYPLTRKISSTQFIIFPRTGHAPQHQFPKLVARYIINFIKHIN